MISYNIANSRYFELGTVLSNLQATQLYLGAVACTLNGAGATNHAP